MLLHIYYGDLRGTLAINLSCVRKLSKRAKQNECKSIHQSNTESTTGINLSIQMQTSYQTEAQQLHKFIRYD